jgi:energy-coupling factor transport system permease protein
MRVPVPVYRPRASALHAARASVGAGFCASLALVVVIYEHPLVLATLLGVVVAAGVACGVGAEVRRAVLLALPLAVLFALINPLVYQGGDTLLIRGGELLGHRLDITLEALVAGLVNGLRIVTLIAAFGLFSAAVDPDRTLKLLGRFSYRSALTASLATRLVPVLARDAFRMGDAARCRAQQPSRFAVARAALAGALDRAVDVAAALEVRGYSGARRPRHARAPWSRHDLRLATAAVAIAAAAVGARLAGTGSVELYPVAEFPVAAAEAALCAGLAACALLPFAGSRARMGVAHG